MLNFSYLENHNAVFLNIVSAISPFKIKGEIVLVFIITLFIFVAFFESKRFKTVRYALIMLLYTFILYLTFFLFKQNIWEWWFLQIHVVFLVITGIILSRLLSHTRLKYAGVAFLTVALFFYSKNTIVLYKNDFYDYGGTAKIQGKLDALDYIYHDARQEEEFGLYIFTPPVYTYAYDYLLWWKYKGEKINNTTSLKEGVFYLLIEKDSDKPWSFEGWIDTVIKDGDVLWRKTLPSGFIIEKRIAAKSSPTEYRKPFLAMCRVCSSAASMAFSLIKTR